jgi:hypothetical protein
MLHGFSIVPAAVIVAMCASASLISAQEHVTVRSDILFYGDNTEFRNPFRDGETIFGSAARAAVVFGLGDRVEIALGGFGNVRFGGDDAFDEAKPVIALTIAGERSTFVFGTLATPRAGRPAGPDRTGPHGLLPPIQRETLAFDRPYEAGLSWRFKGDTVQQELWINWQRVNTTDHRERFDGGAVGKIRLSGWLAVPFNVHIVHEGGQLFASGPVADSSAVATGFDVRIPGARWLETAGIELYGLASRFVPDRSEPFRSRDGGAFFARATGERAGWRGHFLVWRGKHFIKDEGDPNYSALQRDAVEWLGTRDYAEAGVTRTFEPVTNVLLEASGRVHRIEKQYEYSFRILARTALSLKLR